MDEFLTSFVAGPALAGCSHGLITHRYYIKAGNDQRDAFSKLARCG
jgi:hypothetical protein